jgi:hypothetical protein
VRPGSRFIARIDVSGGPLISWFESENHITQYRLLGIITQHPDYTNSDFAIERLVATRADAITDIGSIRPWLRLKHAGVFIDRAPRTQYLIQSPANNLRYQPWMVTTELCAWSRRDAL